MQEFLKAYTSKDAELLAKIDPAEFQKAIGILTEAYRNDRQIFIAGNGGSTGTVNHFSFDFEKNAVQDPSRRRFRIISLAANAAKIIGFGNDVAFEEIFSQQMYPLFNEKDVLILVSSSGTSPDLIQACRYAAKKNGSIIGLTGFAGGRIKDYAAANIIVPDSCYEMIEDVHLAVLHMFVYYFKKHPEVLNG